MHYSKLGNTSTDISNICLGTMTWGTQNTQQDADQQIEYALAKGINFIDTAEMYSIPPNAESYGKTESIIGNWLARNSSERDNIVLASKIAGPGLPYVRDGSGISYDAVIAAVDSSLQRLQTDTIDLYQLHWTNRPNPHFANHWPNTLRINDIDTEAEAASMLNILEGLDSCIQAGKIRYCGLSNDTAWGIKTYLDLAEKHSLPRMVSIQNEFNLLHSTDWPHLIEFCALENLSYLPWSPLAGGSLSAKYLADVIPSGSRWSMEQRNGLFRNTEAAKQAIARYKTLAESAGITTAALALKWCAQIQGVTSTIIGATSMAQLEENIEAFSAPLNDELTEQINQIHKQFPVPF